MKKSIRSLDDDASPAPPPPEKPGKVKKRETIRMNPTGILDESLSSFSSPLLKNSSSKETELSTKAFAQFLRNR